MLPDHVPKAGAQSFQMSNPAVLPTICLLGSLELFHQASMPKLRKKSELLTGYLEVLLTRSLLTPAAGADPTAKPILRILTPRDPQQRGCQLSLCFEHNIEAVHARLEAQGVICDMRRPNVMRIAPTPLYNSFTDVHKFVSILVQVCVCVCVCVCV
jgi:kynureninase